MNDLTTSLGAIKDFLGSGTPAPLPEQFKSRKAFLLAKVDWKLKGALNDPASDQQLCSLEQAYAGLVVPPELRLIYQWADGEKASGLLKPGYQFNSLASALQLHDAYKTMVQEDETLPDLFLRFFPLFSTDNNVDIGIFLNTQESQVQKVYGVGVWDHEFYLFSGSVANYWDSLRECILTAVFKKGESHLEDPHKYLKKETDIVQALEPEAVYPLKKINGQTMFVMDQPEAWPSDLRD